MDAFFGSWKLVKSENFGAILRVCGSEEEIINVLKVVKPVITFSRDGDSLVYKVESVYLKAGSKFRFGEEFYEEVFPGRFCKSTINMDGKKLIHVEVYEGWKVTTVHEIQDGKMIATMTCDDVTAVFTLEKV